MKFILVEHWLRSHSDYPNDYWDYTAEHDTLKEAIAEAYATLTELDENNQSVGETLVSLVIYQASGELNIEDIKIAGKSMRDSE